MWLQYWPALINGSCYCWWCTYNKGEQEEEDGRLGCHHLLDDLLISFILCRLSLLYLFRCTCGCKAWRNLVHDAYTLDGGTVVPNFGLNLLSCISGIRIIIPPPHGHENNNNIKVIRWQYPQGLLYGDASNGFLLYHSSSLIKGRRWGYTLLLHVCNPLTCKSVPLPPLRCFSEPLFLFSMLPYWSQSWPSLQSAIIFCHLLKRERGKIIRESMCFLLRGMPLGTVQVGGGFTSTT